MQQKKLSFYEVNPRYFKDYSGNGIGDLSGLASKFEYFKYLGVDAIILQDVLSVDSLIDKEKSFVKIASEIGDVNNLAQIIALGLKFKIKILIELPIGSISEQNKWFPLIAKQKNKNYQDMVQFFDHKDESSHHYGYLDQTKQYFIKDRETNEIPLNWSSTNVINNFMKVIRYWKEIGVGGFVFKNYEYLGDANKQELMNLETLKVLHQFYREVKELDDNLFIIGRSGKIELINSHKYTQGITKVFDYFLSEKFSENGLHPRYKQDVIGKFKLRKLIEDLRHYGSYSANIVSFDSRYYGRSISRWLNDGQYINEAGKILSTLLLLNKASSAFYYGNEIGVPNIGLTHLDDFQDPTLEKRKALLRTKGINEHHFMNAQITQGAINMRSLMSWDESKNGGFSKAEHTISPVSLRYREINVKHQFISPNSILNFTKGLIKLTKSKLYEQILTHGKFSIKLPSLILPYIKIKIKHRNMSIAVLMNFSGKKVFYRQPHKSDVLISNYNHRNLEELSKNLSPYETLIFVKNVTKANQEILDLAKTKEFFLKKNDHDASRMHKLKTRLSKAEEIETAKDKLADLQQKQKKQKQKRQESLAAQDMQKWVVSDEKKLRDEIARQEREAILASEKKDTNEKVSQIVSSQEVENAEIIEKQIDLPPIAKEELNTVKTEAQVQREAELMRDEEKTQLKDEELAKTMLMPEDVELDDLFDDD